jgi:hypothetical protein
MYVFVEIGGLDAVDCEVGERMLERAGLAGVAAVLGEVRRKVVAHGRYGAERDGGERLGRVCEAARRGVDVLGALGRIAVANVMGSVLRRDDVVKVVSKAVRGAGARVRGHKPSARVLRREAAAGGSAVLWAAERLLGEGYARWRVGYACGWCGAEGLGRELCYLVLRRKRLRAQGTLLAEPAGVGEAYRSLKVACDSFTHEWEGVLYAERVKRVLRPKGQKDKGKPFWWQAGDRGNEARRAVRKAGKTAEEMDKLLAGGKSG